MPERRIARERAVREAPTMQLQGLRRQVPPLYMLITVNVVALAALAHDNEAWALTVGAPVLLVAAGLLRFRTWLARARDPLPDIESATRKLRNTSIIVIAFATAYTLWALALAARADAEGQDHVLLFAALSLVGAIVCLSYLPRMAVAVSTIVLGGHVTFALWQGRMETIAIMGNLVVTIGLVLKVMNDSFNSSIALEASKYELRLRQETTEMLSNENARLAHSDPLTGLPNRRHFMATLDRHLASQRDTPFCVALFDLDGFKPVNDTFGHAQGDKLLATLGTRLKEEMRPGLLIARLGGDEFGVICETGMDEAESAVSALMSVVCMPVRLGETRVSVGCSAGLADFPHAGSTPHELFDHADFALYYAKRHRRGTCKRFSDKLERLIRSEHSLDAALQSANLAEELTLAFQPIVRAATLEPVAVEALARWNSPVIGAVSPEALIATADRIGRSRSVTLALFDKALGALAELPEPLRLTFNLSATDLSDDDTVGALLARLAPHGEAARRLYFEITETSLISDFGSARIALERLKECGSGIALDDFGTGYSCLSSLHQLPIDTLKIDRSFAARLHESKGRQLMLAISNLARSLSLDCVVEGVETEPQLIEANLGGFAYVQGYHIARPAPLETIISMLAITPTQQINAA